MQALEIGKGKVLMQGEKVAILNFGALLNEAKQVAAANHYTLVDMRFAKPLDETLIAELAESHDLLVTLEENAIQGGAGSAVNEYLQKIGKIRPLVMLGIPDFFVPQATQAEAYADLGLDAKGISERIAQIRHTLQNSSSI